MLSMTSLNFDDASFIASAMANLLSVSCFASGNRSLSLCAADKLFSKNFLLLLIHWIGVAEICVN